jgi:hypothetical protein
MRHDPMQCKYEIQRRALPGRFPPEVDDPKLGRCQSVDRPTPMDKRISCGLGRGSLLQIKGR